MKTCPCCGFYIPEPNPRFTREGVLLTPLQMRIYDIVKRAGANGIFHADIYDMLYGHLRNPRTNHAIYVTVHNMNKRFAAAGNTTRVGGTLGAGAVYRIVQAGDISKRNGHARVAR